MSRSILDDRLCFVCEYFDEMASITREFQLLYFYNDNSVEMTEIKTKKLFLRRIECPGLSREQFYLGGSVMIFGRVARLIKFGDEVTRQLCEESAETTSIVLSIDCFSKLGSALAILVEECGFGVKQMNTVVIPDSATAAKYSLPPAFANKPAVVVQAVRRQAIAKGLEYARRVPSCAVAATEEQSKQWESLLSAQSAALQDDANTAIILIKPHALLRRLGGEIVQIIINEGLQVTAACQTTLSAAQADMLLQPYKGVLVDYNSTVQSVAGNSWVVQYTSTDASSSALEKIREVVGPFEPSVAKALYPKSIRARFGEDRVKNAVQVTDVPADCAIYARLFFGK